MFWHLSSVNYLSTNLKLKKFAFQQFYNGFCLIFNFKPYWSRKTHNLKVTHNNMISWVKAIKHVISKITYKNIFKMVLKKITSSNLFEKNDEWMMQNRISAKKSTFFVFLSQRETIVALKKKSSIFLLIHPF